MGERLSSQSTSSVPSAHLRISLPETLGETITINRVSVVRRVDSAAAAAECVFVNLPAISTHRNFVAVINSETLTYSTTTANLRSNLHLD